MHKQHLIVVALVTGLLAGCHVRPSTVYTGSYRLTFGGPRHSRMLVAQESGTDDVAVEPDPKNPHGWAVTLLSNHLQAQDGSRPDKLSWTPGQAFNHAVPGLSGQAYQISEGQVDIHGDHLTLSVVGKAGINTVQVNFDGQRQ